MANTDTYIFAGGGSGGHLFPGIAVAEELRRRDPSCGIVFVGSERPVERSILASTEFEHHALPVESLRELRHSPVRFVRKNWTAMRHAGAILKNRQPRWVIGLGGFASAPTVWTAWRMNIPILLIEQNVIPGAATRWLSRCARHVCLSFDETRGRLRTAVPTVVTGNPVRETILEARRSHRRGPAVADGGLCRTLLILGGSQGAESLNDSVAALLPDLREALSDWRIVHQTGPDRSAAIRTSYQEHGLAAVVDDFFPNIAEQYAHADLVISRSGATTLAELACVGCPALLVPYPFAADQHQTANALAFARQGAAVVIQQASTPAETARRLRAPLINLLTDSQRRNAISQAMARFARPDAAGKLVELLLSDPAFGSPHSPSAELRHSESADYETRIPRLHLNPQELVP
jgi:UDP-N-acetylglucosamine--N-acetylmuramyl-(pentapeptide) pyrophosphoryl-undecaprenol N-acetylglucosamine transferase